MERSWVNHNELPNPCPLGGFGREKEEYTQRLDWKLLLVTLLIRNPQVDFLSAVNTKQVSYDCGVIKSLYDFPKMKFIKGTMVKDEHINPYELREGGNVCDKNSE